ncbi:HGxxPAAW family protein [Streptomyces sp. NPDC056161]|uniref:HGxxPAAW family protein n=1 Tax=Streptomyces sp. NPDC056161 TaxID=3345732 RepID=UPI0035E30C39
MSGQHDEGHTVAGWTGALIATVGSTVAGLGVVMASAAVVGGGTGIVAVAVLVTWVLHLVGWGKPPGPRPRETWGMRVRDAGARDGHVGCVACRLAGRERRTAVVAAGAGNGEPESAVAEAGH